MRLKLKEGIVVGEGIWGGKGPKSRDPYTINNSRVGELLRALPACREGCKFETPTRDDLSGSVSHWESGENPSIGIRSGQFVGGEETKAGRILLTRLRPKTANEFLRILIFEQELEPFDTELWFNSSHNNLFRRKRWNQGVMKRS